MAATEGQGANGSSKEAKPIRVWCDGCFDAAHYGHANQLRQRIQASLLGDVLVAGVHRDAEIAANKGPPVFTEQERYRLIAAVKWVDETQLSTLDEFNCDFCVHGDDLSLFADGTDTFAEVKAQKRYREVARTPGISTTDLVGRMVLLSTDHHLKPGPKDQQDKVRGSVKAQKRYREVDRTPGISTTDLVGRMVLLSTDHHLKPGPKDQQDKVRGSVKAQKRYREVARTPGISTTDLVGRMVLLSTDHHLKPGPKDQQDKVRGSVKAQKRYREVARTPGISTTDLVGRMVLLSTDHHVKPGPKDQQDKLPNLIPRPSVFVSDLVQLFSSHEKPTPGQEVVYVAGAFDFFHIGHLCFLEKVAKEGRFVLVGVHSDAVVNGLRGQNFPVMSLYERVLGVLANRYVHQVLIGPDYSLSEEFIAKHRIDRVIHGRSIVRPDPATGRDPYEVPKGLGIFETVDSGSEIFTDDIFQRIIDRRLQYIKRNEKKAAKEENAYAKLKAQSKTTMDA